MRVTLMAVFVLAAGLASAQDNRCRQDGDVWECVCTTDVGEGVERSKHRSVAAAEACASVEPPPRLRIHLGGSTSDGLTGTRAAEVARLLGAYSEIQECQEANLVPTLSLSRAHLRVVLDHNYGGQNDVALFDANGDFMFGNRTTRLVNAVKDVCEHITGLPDREWPTVWEAVSTVE